MTTLLQPHSTFLTINSLRLYCFDSAAQRA
jgi:hypothetical protein